MSAENADLDYSTYSHADLLKRITDLEAQLRSLHRSHATSASPPLIPPAKKIKKAAKTFDASKYHTRVIALKFAYIGSNYNGFEHHSNNKTPLPTIEEVLWKALRKTKLIFPDFRRVGGNEEEVCWDGTEYSKCGRTDRGVSAFGQVIGLRVRSSRPKSISKMGALEEKMRNNAARSGTESPHHNASDGLETNLCIEDHTVSGWDPIRDELPYIQLINRVLPPDIRILAWCPNPPPNFSARFNCKERRYRYFFTNPAFPSAPGSSEGRLDISAMERAAKKYEGLHDFRNFCKIDPSKQISNFERRIFHAGIHKVQQTLPNIRYISQPELYYFEVRGSAFLWHQVRHLVAILFLIGQHYEAPELVDELLDIEKCPSRPMYDMASDAPLVLWDCIFPDPQRATQADHISNSTSNDAYEDALEWIHVSDNTTDSDFTRRMVRGIDDGMYGANGIVNELWAQWRKRKIDEVLAANLMELVVRPDNRRILQAHATGNPAQSEAIPKSRVFDGSDRVRIAGRYIPIMQRERMESPEIVNARYAARKNLSERSSIEADPE
ncbi:hypothetical protein M433DRAFT_62901 [Acidomyces richmondensis BFW]|nr:MAG: hypothetical protein FE78DRAFT_141226 [Acidomyces sp. 'richmondensis']KYG47534.1 hypothetical protein M433DRAFT_62901 [Acidomyces richmondensis BFW]